MMRVNAARLVTIAASLILLSSLSYWISIFLATYVSHGALRLSTEWPLVLGSIGLAFVCAGVLYQLRGIDSPSPANPLEKGLGIRAEWSAYRVELGAVLLITGLIFVLIWRAWGVSFAADGSAFMLYYLQLRESDPVYQAMLLYWTPLAPLLHGGLLDLGGVTLFTIAGLALALFSGVALYLTARPWGKFSAGLVIALWWAHLPQQLHYHLIGADALMIWLMPFLLYGLRLAVSYQRWGLWFGVGLLLGLLTLTRPANLLMAACLIALLGAYPFHLKLKLRPSFFLKLKFKQAFVKPAAVALAGLLIVLTPHLLHNAIRYEYLGLTRGSNLLWWAGVYVPDSMVYAENGAASQEFADMLQHKLLTTETYQGVSLDDFLRYPSSVTFDDAISLVDREKGWDSEYALLRQVAFEAIQADPATFARRYLRDLAKLVGIKELVTLRPEGGHAIPAESDIEVWLVPQTYQTFMLSNPHMERPSDERISAARAALNAFIAPVNDYGGGNRALADALADLWTRFGLSPLLWLSALPLALWGARGAARWYLLGILWAAAGVILSAALSHPEPRYRMTLDPIFLLVLVIGLERIREFLKKR